MSDNIRQMKLKRMDTSSRIKIYKLIATIFVTLGAAVMLYPLVWMVVSSFKPEIEIFRDKSLIIREFTFSHYIRGLKGVAGTSFLDYMWNSMKVVLPVVLGNLISCSMVGYAVARLEFSSPISCGAVKRLKFVKDRYKECKIG